MNTPNEILELPFMERVRLASNADTPVDVLRELSGEEIVYIRRLVAANPSTSPDVLKELAFDSSAEVQAGVFRNPSLPLKEMVNSVNATVRFYVAIHPFADFKILVKLVNDEFPAIASAAREKLENLDESSFAGGLTECGFGMLVGLPREWAMKALCSEAV